MRYALVIPLLLLDVLVFAASLMLLGIPYYMLVESGDLPFLLKLLRAERASL